MDPKTWFPQEFPLYYSADAQFQANGAPSGDRGAEAQLRWQLNNYPHLVFGVRLTFAWEPVVLPQLVGPPVVVYQDEQFQRLDEECVMDLKLTQQNITANLLNHHVRNIQGSRQINYHPFPAPYLARGANTIESTLRRLVSYPEFPREGQEPLRILPRVFGTLVTVSLVDDLVPAKGPPSTEDLRTWLANRTQGVLAE